MVNLTFAENLDDVRASIMTFCSAIKTDPSLCTSLAQTTSYWVVDQKSNEFGPAKFIGFKGMDPNTYQTARSGQFAGDRFNGYDTRKVIEKLCDVSFKPSHILEDRLKKWIASRLGESVLKKVDSSKWAFIEMPTNGDSKTSVSNLGLMLNGKASWYENIWNSFKVNNGMTWLQQTMTIGKAYSDAFQEIIDCEGHFVAFGYIQSPVKKVQYIFWIDKIHTQHSEGVPPKSVTNGRVPPPDETVPGFDPEYDVQQGHCIDASDYKYKMWLRVKNVIAIEPIDPNEFKPYTKEGPFKVGRAAHFYIDVANINDLLGAVLKNSIYSPSEKDSRKRTLSEIVARQGQGTFRKALLAAYSGKCAITGSDAWDALEAAHISPYMGEHTNVIQNGLLLRADLHSLFDLGKIAINSSDFRIILHPDLRSGYYSGLHGKMISLPTNKNEWPSKEALDKHREYCGL